MTGRPSTEDPDYAANVGDGAIAVVVAGPDRLRVLRIVADDVAAVEGRDVTRVAVDGVDGAGKTVFADALAGLLRERGMTVIRATVDGFHHPRDVRYRRGRRSPEGFFHDSHDYEALRRFLLDPLSPGGNRRYKQAIYDVVAERPIATPDEFAESGSVLVFDGIFLHRPELRRYWDHSVFLHVPFEVSVPRGAGRGYGDPDPTSPDNRRYVDGQRIYLERCRPEQQATVVVDNTDVDRPAVLSHPVAQ